MVNGRQETSTFGGSGSMDGDGKSGFCFEKEDGIFFHDAKLGEPERDEPRMKNCKD
jgi:hypothetical protein